MRLVLFALLLAAPAALAQQDNRCLSSCGDNMVTCTSRCGNDGNCAGGCMKHLNDCNQRCQDNGKVKLDRVKQKLCPGEKGKMIACADMMKPASAVPKRKPAEETYPNKAAKELMKNPEKYQ